MTFNKIFVLEFSSEILYGAGGTNILLKHFGICHFEISELLGWGTVEKVLVWSAAGREATILYSNVSSTTLKGYTQSFFLSYHIKWSIIWKVSASTTKLILNFASEKVVVSLVTQNVACIQMLIYNLPRNRRRWLRYLWKVLNV